MNTRTLHSTDQGPHAPGPTLTLTADGGDERLQRIALNLWAGTSGQPLRAEWLVAPEAAAYLRLLQREHGSIERITVAPSPGPLSGLPPVAPGDPMWVAFSGGKDGLATALMARDRGHDVTLYHVAGMNRSVAAAEERAAGVAAEAAGLPLVVDRVSQTGQRAGFVEVPTRNQVIVTLMAAHMAEAGVRTYGLGNALSDQVQGYLVAYSDLLDAVGLWHAYLDTLVPGLHQRTYLRQQTESVAVLAAHGLLSVPHGSCMAPMRYRAGYRAANERRYGPLLPGRCGSCGKCTWEALVMDALGLPTPGADYLRHCAEYLARKVQAASGGALQTPAQVVAHWVDAAIVAEYRPLFTGGTAAGG